MGEKIVALAGKLGVDPEMVQLAMRVYVPPHVRMRDGKRQNVDGYWRTVTRNSPLTGDEVKAIQKKAKELIGPDLKAGMKSPNLKVQRRQAEIDAVNKDWDVQRTKTINAIPPNIPDNPYDSLPREAADIVKQRGMRKMNVSPETARAVRTQDAGRRALPGGTDRVNPPRFKKGQRVRVDTEQGWEEGEVFAIAREVVPGEGNRYEIKFDDGTHTNFGEQKVWPQKKSDRLTESGARTSGSKEQEAEATAILDELIGTGLLDEDTLDEVADPLWGAYDTLQELIGSGLVNKKDVDKIRKYLKK